MAKKNKGLFSFAIFLVGFSIALSFTAKGMVFDLTAGVAMLIAVILLFFHFKS